MTATRIDPWHNAYARRAAGMTASEIRALFAVASRPEVVSLAGGMPPVDGLPLELVSDIARRAVAEHAVTALQYGAAQGEASLRDAVVEVAAASGVRTHAGEVVITTGSQQALDLLARILLDPGDVVLVESPSYVGALGVFRSYEADIRHLPCDAEGLLPESIEGVVARERGLGRAVKLLYLVPNHHNPSGVTTSSARRVQIMLAASRCGVLVVEDDPYSLLGFDGEPGPPLHALDPTGVVYLGSFSKTFAPGLRTGFAVAPPAIRDKLVLAAESAMLCPSALSQQVIAMYLREYPWRNHVKGLRELYRERCEAMLAALAHYLPDAHWQAPRGGFFVWVELPGDTDARALLPRAVAARVAYVPGTAFFADGQGHSHARLSFCFPPPVDITEGVRRLASVVREEEAVRGAFRS